MGVVSVFLSCVSVSVVCLSVCPFLFLFVSVEDMRSIEGGIRLLKKYLRLQ